jgi:hypothetical protein
LIRIYNPPTASYILYFYFKKYIIYYHFNVSTLTTMSISIGNPHREKVLNSIGQHLNLPYFSLKQKFPCTVANFDPINILRQYPFEHNIKCSNVSYHMRAIPDNRNKLLMTLFGDKDNNRIKAGIAVRYFAENRDQGFDYFYKGRVGQVESILRDEDDGNLWIRMTNNDEISGEQLVIFYDNPIIGYDYGYYDNLGQFGLLCDFPDEAFELSSEFIPLGKASMEQVWEFLIFEEQKEKYAFKHYRFARLDKESTKQPPWWKSSLVHRFLVPIVRAFIGPSPFSDKLLFRCRQMSMQEKSLLFSAEAISLNTSIRNEISSIFGCNHKDEGRGSSEPPIICTGSTDTALLNGCKAGCWQGDTIYLDRPEDVKKKQSSRERALEKLESEEREEYYDCWGLDLICTVERGITDALDLAYDKDKNRLRLKEEVEIEGLAEVTDDDGSGDDDGGDDDDEDSQEEIERNCEEYSRIVPADYDELIHKVSQTAKFLRDDAKTKSMLEVRVVRMAFFSDNIHRALEYTNFAVQKFRESLIKEDIVVSFTTQQYLQWIDYAKTSLCCARIALQRIDSEKEEEGASNEEEDYDCTTTMAPPQGASSSFSSSTASGDVAAAKQLVQDPFIPPGQAGSAVSVALAPSSPPPAASVLGLPPRGRRPLSTGVAVPTITAGCGGGGKGDHDPDDVDEDDSISSLDWDDVVLQEHFKHHGFLFDTQDVAAVYHQLMLARSLQEPLLTADDWYTCFSLNAVSDTSSTRQHRLDLVHRKIFELDDVIRFVRTVYYDHSRHTDSTRISDGGQRRPCWYSKYRRSIRMKNKHLVTCQEWTRRYQELIDKQLFDQSCGCQLSTTTTSTTTDLRGPIFNKLLLLQDFLDHVKEMDTATSTAWKIVNSLFFLGGPQMWTRIDENGDRICWWLNALQVALLRHNFALLAARRISALVEEQDRNCDSCGAPMENHCNDHIYQEKLRLTDSQDDYLMKVQHKNMRVYEQQGDEIDEDEPHALVEDGVSYHRVRSLFAMKMFDEDDEEWYDDGDEDDIHFWGFSKIDT